MAHHNIFDITNKVTINHAEYLEIKDGNDYYYYESSPLQGKTHRVRFVKTFGRYQSVNKVVKIEPIDNQNIFEKARFQNALSGNVVAFRGESDHNIYIVADDYGFSLQHSPQIYSDLTLEQRIALVRSLLNEVEKLEQQGIFHNNLCPEHICVQYNEHQGIFQ